MTTPPTQTPPTQSFVEQLQDFFAGLMTLDPQQAAIRGGLSALVLTGALLLMWGLHVLLKTLAERVTAPNQERPGVSRIGRWTLRVARVAIFLTAILVMLRVWGFDLEQLSRGPVGAILGTAGRIALIIVLSLAAIEVSQLAIKGTFGRIANRARNIRRASQLRTLAPVLTGVATSTLVVVAAMMTLSEIGVEIGPLIAGAGIVGLAIGFGAQTIVKDFLTGIFLIIEDAVSVGDVIAIGEFGGVVEEMSIRTIKLRDFDGTLHIFPYSEAQVINNRTKGFSFAVFNFNLAIDTDIGVVLDVMRKVGDEQRANESFAPFILAPIEVVGLDKLTDTGALVKARIKTAPGKQWMIGRDYNVRVKTAFDAAGVAFAATTMKLVTPDAPLVAPPLRDA
jgi:small-conductance mechanosensitive channel